jgi:hypothetical protein
MRRWKMKLLRFAMMDANKTAEVAKAADKVAASLPPGIKISASYACQGIAFPGVPAQTLVVVQVVEAESNEAIAASTWPLELAGATIWDVPVLELPVAGAAEVEKKMRG